MSRTESRRDVGEASGCATGWSLWRQDDHGNRFEVRRGVGLEAAERLRAELEAGGHKQTYWVEPTARPVGTRTGTEVHDDAG